MPDRPCLSFTQIQAAMQAMIEKAMQLPEEPVAMAIVDATGNLLAYNTMDKQYPQSTRRNALPVKLIDGSLLMGHEYLACALV